MQSRKAQLTIYIVLGLLILIVSAFVLMRNRTTLQPEESLPIDLQPAKEYLQQCMQQSLDSAVRTVASYGGYAEPPAEVLEYRVPFLPDPEWYAYYLNGNAPLVPSRDAVSTTVATLMRRKVVMCTQNVSTVKGYTIDLGPTAIDITLGQGDVQATLNGAVTLRGKQNTYRASGMQTAAALPLGAMLALAAHLTSIQQQNLTSWCASCVAELQTPEIAIVPAFTAGDGDTTILYTLLQRDASRPLAFRFAHGLPHIAMIQEPELPEIDQLTATVGQPFTYELPRWDGEALYSDDSPLFAIDPFSGKIAFTPTAADIGQYVTTITMKLPDGNFAQETFTLEVHP